mmetsp:Transcript_2654/g.10535  ORF Transcript_2654/g.10535 Transcript_2654/m.10535 type:complete len:443 (-) Transcript_2654:12-1340(-)
MALPAGPSARRPVGPVVLRRSVVVISCPVRASAECWATLPIQRQNSRNALPTSSAHAPGSHAERGPFAAVDALQLPPTAQRERPGNATRSEHAALHANAGRAPPPPKHHSRPQPHAQGCLPRSEHRDPGLVARPRPPLRRASLPGFLAHHRRAIGGCCKLHRGPAGRARLPLRSSRRRPCGSRACADAHAGDSARQAPKVPRRGRPGGPQALEHAGRKVGERPFLLPGVAAHAVVPDPGLDTRLSSPLLLQPLEANADPAPRGRARSRCRRPSLGRLGRGRRRVRRRHPHPAAAPTGRHGGLALPPDDGLCRSPPGRAVALGGGGLASLLRGGLRPCTLDHVPGRLLAGPGGSGCLGACGRPTRFSAGGARAGGGVPGRGGDGSAAGAGVSPARRSAGQGHGRPGGVSALAVVGPGAASPRWGACPVPRHRDLRRAERGRVP